VVRMTRAVAVPTAVTQTGLSVLICEAVKKRFQYTYNLFISTDYAIVVSAESSCLKQVIYGLMHVM